MLETPLLASLQAAWGILLFRGFPFVVAAAVALPSAPSRRDALWLAWGGILALGASLYLDLSNVVPFLAIGYGLATGFVVLGFASAVLTIHWIGRVLYGALCFGLFVALAALWAPPAWRIPFTVLGMDFALSMYSFGVEQSRPDARAGTITQALYFVLVHPPLVYRASEKPEGDIAALPAILRVLLGTTLLAGATWAQPSVFATTSAPSDWERVHEPLSYAYFLAANLARGLTFYAMHLGLAGMQEGYSALAGRPVRRRYNHPWRATSMREFWRRWNTWMLEWLWLYVFVQLAPDRARASRQTDVRRTARGVGALFGTFVVAGFLHDAVAFTGHLSDRRPVLSLATTIVFTFAAAAVAVETYAARRLNRRGALLAVAQWSLYIQVQCFFIWMVLKAVTARGLPPQVLALWRWASS